MTSSIVWFDTGRMVHIRSRSLGLGRGSLTWLDWHAGSWWACFANYDGKGGEPGRDHRYTTLVRFSPAFEDQGAWVFPQDVLERFAPHSSSGGIWGDDGLLYVTGHDLPEMYVLRLPAAGSSLEHVATVQIPGEGQAISWPRGGRMLWSISRARHEAIQAHVPAIWVPASGSSDGCQGCPSPRVQAVVTSRCSTMLAALPALRNSSSLPA